MAKVRILIIEDNRQESEELKSSLIHLGYEVTEVAENLKDALGCFYSQNPDVILIDIYLNGQPDGLEFARKIKASPQLVKPFIFITSAADKATFDQAMKTLPDSYLIKPFNPLEVQYAIELALEKFYGGGGVFSVRNEMAIEASRDFYVKKGHVLHKVTSSDIYLAAVEGKFSELVTETDKYLVQWSLRNVVEKINREDFVRVHRNYAVNTRMISKVHLKDQQLVLKNNLTVPFSQNFKENFKKNIDVLN